MKKFGKYLLERQLAIGGMAEVFLARQHGPAGFEKTLVVKRILPSYANDEQFITMFLDEARTSAKLNHPNLVQIYELGEIDGAYYLAMEYIRGESLNKVIRKLQGLAVHMPLHLAAKIVASVCAGLDYAHNFAGADGEPLGLVHRDISPDNVLVSHAGAVKMIDFGIAKARTSEAKTQAGAVKGKFCYMSPEQVTGKRLDRRSDIFSLGIVLHELTTLSRPFGDGADLMTVSAIVNDPPVRASEVVEGYPNDLWEIISRALEKDVKKRYQDAHEMQTALERFIHSRGEFLSDRDIGAYVRKLFSENEQDIEELRAMTSGIRSRVLLPPTVALQAPSEREMEPTQVAEAVAEDGTVVSGAEAQAVTLRNEERHGEAEAGASDAGDSSGAGEDHDWDPTVATTQEEHDLPDTAPMSGKEAAAASDGARALPDLARPDRARTAVTGRSRPGAANEVATRPVGALPVGQTSGGGSVFRYLLALVLLAGLCAGGYFLYRHLVDPAGPGKSGGTSAGPVPVLVDASAEGTDGGAATEEPDAGAVAEEPDAGAVAEEPDAGAVAAEPDAGELPADQDAGDVPVDQDTEAAGEPADAEEPEADVPAVVAGQDAGEEPAVDGGAAAEPDAGTEAIATDSGAAGSEPDVPPAVEVPDAGLVEAVADPGAEPAPDAGAEQSPDAGPPVEPDATARASPDAGQDGGAPATLIVKRGPNAPALSLAVDGKNVGMAPKTLRLKPGQHVLVAEGRGFKKSYPLVLGPAEERTLVIAGPAAPEGEGTIVFALPAGTRVFLGGKLLGKAPVPPAKVPYGNHAIRLEHPDDATRSVKKQVRIGPGRTQVKISL